MTTPRAAVIYARISSDVEGTGQGVTRQLQDCRKLAARLGWTVAEEYVHNDMSAYSGKVRPNYQRMLADLRDGYRDGVLVYHVDRLTRRPVELEEFVTVVDASGVRDVKFVVGDMDLATGDGLLFARIQGAMAANSSAAKSRRVRRKMDQLAEEGLPNGGPRPFGYEADRRTVNPEEAALIRTMAARCLAGESTRSLAAWLNDEGIASVSGKEWRTTTVRGILMSARIAGLREHHGETIGRAAWEPIISQEEHRRLRATFAQRAVSGRRAPQRYLLSGLLRCGKCERTLYSSPRKATRRYVCLAGPDHGGCGRLTVVADPLERLIADGVVLRLDAPELADALSGRAAKGQQTAAVAEQASGDREQLTELPTRMRPARSAWPSGYGRGSRSRRASRTGSAAWPAPQTRPRLTAWSATATPYADSGPTSTSTGKTRSLPPCWTTRSSSPASPGRAAST